jgi:hypothetical protein
MPTGAPTKYKKELCEKVKELMRQGYSVTQVASKLEVHRDTLYEWAKVHDEFSDALKIGKMHLEHWYTELFREMAVGKRKGNPVAAIWLTKNVLGWSDKFQLHESNDIEFETEPNE